MAERALLLDARWFGVALGDDEAAQRISVLAGHFGPHGLAEVVPEPDPAVGDRIGQEDAPAVVGHLHVVEVGPPRVVDRDGRAQENVVSLKALRPHLAPPREVLGLPFDESALQLLVAREVDVVRNLVVVDDVGHGYVLPKSNSGLSGLPYRVRAPDAPTAFGR